MAQWHPDRYKALVSKGFNLRTLHGQLDGLLHELNTTENDAYRKLLKTKTPEEATDTFMIHYGKDPKYSTKEILTLLSNYFKEQAKKEESPKIIKDL